MLLAIVAGTGVGVGGGNCAWLIDGDGCDAIVVCGAGAGGGKAAVVMLAAGVRFEVVGAAAALGGVVFALAVGKVILTGCGPDLAWVVTGIGGGTGLRKSKVILSLSPIAI